MADNTLTGLIQTIYKSLDTVSREQVGFIPAVRRFDFDNKKVAQNEPITYPVVPSFGAPSAISASNIISDPSGITVGHNTILMDNVNMISWGWNGEEATGLGNSGIFATTQTDAFTQAFRAFALQIEQTIAALAIQGSRASGTAGTIPFTTTDDLSDLNNPREILQNNGQYFPGKMQMVLSNTALNKLRSKQGIVFKANEAGTMDRQLTGVVTQLEGWNLHETVSAPSHTAGTGALYVVDGNVAAGATTIAIKTGSGTVVAGDVVAIPSANGVTYKYLVKTGVVAAGNIVITAPGVVSAISDGATVTIEATYKANVAFQQDAITLISALPNLPENGDQAVNRINVQDKWTGLLFEVSEYKGFRKTIYVVAAAFGAAVVKPEGVALLVQ